MQSHAFHAILRCIFCISLILFQLIELCLRSLYLYLQTANGPFCSLRINDYCEFEFTVILKILTKDRYACLHLRLSLLLFLIFFCTMQLYSQFSMLYKNIIYNNIMFLRLPVIVSNLCCQKVSNCFGVSSSLVWSLPI